MYKTGKRTALALCTALILTGVGATQVGAVQVPDVPDYLEYELDMGLGKETTKGDTVTGATNNESDITEVDNSDLDNFAKLPDNSIDYVDGNYTANELHLDIIYDGGGRYFPLVSISVKNTRTGKEVPVFVSNSTHEVDKEKGAVSVKIPNFEFKNKDKLEIKIKALDDLLIGLFTTDKQENVTLYKDKAKTIQLDAIKEVGVNEKPVLEGTEKSPIPIYTTYKDNKFIYNVQTDDGTPIVDTEVVIIVGDNEKNKIEMTTDDKGNILLDRDKIKPNFTIRVPGYGGTIVDLPFNAFTDEDMTTVHEENITIVEDTDVQEKPSGDENGNDVGTVDRDLIEYTVKHTTSYDTRLSTKWLTSNLVFEDGKQRKVTKKESKIKLSKDKKIKNVTSKTAKVVGYKINGTVITVELEPLNTFTLHDNGNEYDVTFLNKKGLNIKGTEKLVFGLAPNEKLQIKDNKRGKTYGYTAGSGKDGKTSNSELIVSKGKDGKTSNGEEYTNPHTNDIIKPLVATLLLAVLLIVGLLVLKRKHKYINMLIILTLLGSTLAPYGSQKVNADSNVGGGYSDTNAGSGLSGKMLQMVEYIAAYEVYFVKTDIGSNVQQKENYYIESQGKQRFDRASRATAFYFTPDQLTYKSLTNSGSGVVEYADNIGSHQSASAVYNLQVIKGTNAIKNYLGSDLVKDTKSSSHAELMKHVIEPRYTVPNNSQQGTGDFFINTMGGIVKEAYNRSSANTLAPLSGSYMNGTPSGMKDVFGEAASKQFNKILSDDTKPETKVNREKLVKSYLELVKHRRLVSDYNSFEDGILKAMNNGQLAVQVNTIVGITQYNSRNNKPHGAKPYAFMSVHDASTWYYYQMKMLRPPANVPTLNTEHEKKTANVGLPADSNLYWKWGRIGFTFRQYLRNAYTITAQPKGEEGKFPVIGSPTSDGATLNKNPYGGWFFQLLGEVDGGGKPTIYVTAELKDKETGKEIPIKIPEWAKNKNIELGTLSSAKVTIKDKYVIGKNTYKVNADAPVEVTSADEVWKSSTQIGLDKLTPPKTKESFLNKKDLSKTGGGTEKVTTALESNVFNVYKHIETGGKLSRYLGGMAQEKAIVADKTIINKYFNTKYNSNNVVGDLHIHLVIEAEKEEPEEQKFEYEVPQWSLAEVEHEDFKDDKLITILDIGSITDIEPDKENIGRKQYNGTKYPIDTDIYIETKTKEGVKKADGSIPFFMDNTEPMIEQSISWYQPKVEYDENKLKPKYFEYVDEKQILGLHKQPSSQRPSAGSQIGSVSEFTKLNDMVYEAPIKTQLRLIRSYKELDLDLEKFNEATENDASNINVPSKVNGADSRYLAEFIESNTENFYVPFSYKPSEDIVKEDKIKKESTLLRKNSVLLNKWQVLRGETAELTVKQKLNYTNKYKEYISRSCSGRNPDGSSYSYSCGYWSHTTAQRTFPKSGHDEQKLEHNSEELKTDFKVTFNKYQAKEQEGIAKLPKEAKASGGFSTWSIIDDERKFKYYPEIVMYNEIKVDQDTEEYEYTVETVLGEEERKLNTHFFVKADIVPKDDTGEVTIKANVNGSASTDAQAQALAQGLNTVQNTPVLPKGSATVNNLGLENAEIDMRFYLLDIKDNVVKEKFNPDSTSWDTSEEIVEEYLESLKNDKGEIKGTARGYYYVGDTAHEPVLKDIGFRQVAEPEVKEYELEVRGGELTKIEGVELEPIREEIKERYGDNALDVCKNDKVYERNQELSVTCATTALAMFNDTDGLFSKLEKEQGDSIEEGWEDYVTDANELRNLEEDHNKALEVGKEWYYEDTTIFIIREHHYKFSVPSFMWTAKLPMEFAGLGIETPVDKSQYYSKGIEGYIGTEFKFGDKDKFELVFDINSKMIEEEDYGLLKNNKKHQYIVPNTSILDALR